MSWLNPGRWLLYGGLVLALVLGYQAWQQHQRHLGYAQAVAEFQAQAAQTNKARAAVNAPIEAADRAAVAQIQTVTNTITREVPIYVQNSDCHAGLGGGVRVLHDAAAHGEVPSPADVAHAASVALEDLATTVADNYGACLQNARQLTDLQAWIQKQQTLN